MRAALMQRAARARSNSLSTLPPSNASQDYLHEYAIAAASILYRSPLATQSGLPLYILNASALPDAHELDYDALLPYVLARFPGEDDLIAGTEYEVVLFAGGQAETATGDQKSGPGVGWYIRVYQVLSRALRKRLQRVWIVHERSWVRVLTEVFSTIVSPKFKKKVTHVNSLSGLALHIPIERLLIPPAVYLHDRRVSPDIYAPYASGPRAFAAETPLVTNPDGSTRLPRVLREATSFILNESNLQIEGIFRIPPHSVTLAVLQEAYDRGQHFIIFKEGSASLAEPLTPPHVMAEVSESDAYGVHVAAGLIKVWYRKLSAPVFPEKSYETLREHADSLDGPLTVEVLASLLSPSAQDSPFPIQSRIVLTTHLVPLLSIVSSYVKQNRMTPENLAVCFAPALINGSDQMEDAKMTSTIRRFVAAAVSLWSEGLESMCDASEARFFDSLKPPADPGQYEDPLPDPVGRRMRPAGEERRIRMDDLDNADEAPPLPPRKTCDAQMHEQTRETISAPVPKRKPAPPLGKPPRYSSLVHSPSSARPPAYTRELNGDEKSGLADAQNGFGSEKQEESHDLRIGNTTHSLAALTINGTSLSRPSSSTGSTPVASPAYAPSLTDIQDAQLRSVSGASVKSSSSAADDTLFVKPTWAASSRKASASSITSTQRKPTPPLKVLKNGIGGDQQGRPETSTAGTPYVPKPRAPSPGLLQRMQSWEKEAGDEHEGGQSNAEVSVRKQSVDDLRRLYEERANTVAALPPIARTRSAASDRSAS